MIINFLIKNKFYIFVMLKNNIMKNHNLVWIPFFGIYLLKFNPFIIKYEPWLSYQLICIIVFGIYILSIVFKIASFLIFIS